ncbi:MAG: hypothetical protein LBJ40_22785 [Delftia acidovorans]|jgi:hypothetical protein|nr:hypothetical protein [Delftia acidovorans]
MDHQQKDETAVAYLATAMNTKLARARAKGRSGWDTPECTQQHLSNLLREHVEKGDPVDVANFCAFLAARGEGIAPRQCVAQIEEPAGAAPAAVARWGCEDRSAWFALAMGAAASLEDAANCLRDKDAQKAAMGAATHVRESCNKLWWSVPALEAPATSLRDAAANALAALERTQHASDADRLAAADQLRNALAAAPQAPAVRAALSEGVILAVDKWFSQNTGLGGCSDKDAAELAAIFAAAPQAPAAPDDVLCYIRAGATLPERHGFEVCRATDAGAMAVMGDGRVSAPAAPAVDASDTALLDALAAESMDLRCFDMPTGQGDADVGWRVIQHHMGAPTERVVSEVYKDDPRSAIRAAIARLERDPYCTGALHEEAAAQAAAKGEHDE